ncbi:MAG: hypothetical protein KBD53_02290 [Candidatus Omnitrophica bacterium]|nr:hypothetical protein [Candidatus Omnitrophota bacterium]
MSEAQTVQIPWETKASEKYMLMISKIPLFHRDIAKQVVDKQAVINAQQRGSTQVEEGDIILAFFSEVPMTFYSLMIRLFQNVGFDYKKYEPK